jgi:hypothetical protein
MNPVRSFQFARLLAPELTTLGRRKAVHSARLHSGLQSNNDIGRSLEEAEGV